jgi:hypothetical protein
LHVVEASKLIGYVFNGDDHPLSRYGTAYGRSLDPDSTAWWGRAARTVSGSFRRGTAA